MKRRDKFESLRGHLIIGKMFKKLTAKEVKFCEEFLDATEGLDDDRYSLTVNRLGVQTSFDMEFRTLKNKSHIWALLSQAVEPNIRRQR